jgi:hypothetical protein
MIKRFGCNTLKNMKKVFKLEANLEKKLKEDLKVFLNMKRFYV